MSNNVIAINNRGKIIRLLGNGRKPPPSMDVLGSLTAMIVHDIAKPLSLIKLKLSELQNGDGLPIFIGEGLEAIQLQNDFIVGLINQLRDTIRSSTYPRHWLSVNDLLRSKVFDLFIGKIEFRNIKIVLNLSEDTPKIHITEMEFYQIMFNLIENAADAIIEREMLARNHLGDTGEWVKEITITTRIGKGNPEMGVPPEVEISVSDNGTGIREDQDKSIFDSFVTTKKHNGTGLGLAIVRHIVEDLNGSVKVENSKPLQMNEAWSSVNGGRHGGAVFRVRIPVNNVLAANGISTKKAFDNRK